MKNKIKFHYISQIKYSKIIDTYFFFFDLTFINKDIAL